MKKTVGVIIAVCLVEALMRLSYRHIGINPVLYTLIARLIQAGIIMGAAFNESGIKAKNAKRELLLGFAISIAFGFVVLSGDLLSRIALPGGYLGLILKRQFVRNPVFFIFVGCIAAPFVEELFFRGLIQSFVRKYTPAIFAIAMSSAFFAFMHGTLSVVQVAGGIMFGIIYEWRGNIWAAYVFHAIANLGIFICPFLWPIIVGRLL